MSIAVPPPPTAELVVDVRPELVEELHLPHRHLTDDPAVHGLEFAVDVDVDVAAAVSVPLDAGGATFHHPRTFHHTGPNATGRRRRADADEVQTPPVPAGSRADAAPSRGGA